MEQLFTLNWQSNSTYLRYFLFDIKFQSDISPSVIHLYTGCEDILLAWQESGISVYCFEAMNAMTKFYSLFYGLQNKQQWNGK